MPEPREIGQIECNHLTLLAIVSAFGLTAYCEFCHNWVQVEVEHE